ncbi:MAG: phospho-N-acetylmuramoyl-pentapeptide-transferase [Oscillospiraceae bacterium]|nr:phospho-N-acetylmuramoyl-pentapeptide-transferase [Oscillospiraceae bacterium]
MILTLVGAVLIAAVLAVVAGIILIPVLRRLKAGQSIKENGPVWHMHKQGTPTMGGLIFIPAVVLTTLGLCMKELAAGELAHVAMLVLALIFGAIGFLDDFEKVKKKGNTGLTALPKFLLQLAAALAFLLVLRLEGYITPNLYIPYFNVSVKLPEVVYFILAAFIIVGTVNAVNITDGVDGLLTGVTLPVAIFFVFAAAKWGLRVQGVFAAALAGSLAAFLIFNFNPAKVFMGDTGSLFIGGAVCAMAFSMDMPLVLVPLGMVYIIETLSDIIQVVYFKLSHGKRIFKMAPIHHHFEKCGWSEKKVFFVFTGASIVFAVIAWLGVMFRYSA